MPELTLFRRRWHTSTDALPVLMVLLCIFHVLWFVPYATGSWSIEGTGLHHECSHATELRLANYSLFALFGLAAINEAVLTMLGLRGGPFETKKRRGMSLLLYLEFAIWVLLLGFTIYATIIVYSPAVSESCWSNNPCQYNPDVFPLSCRDRHGTGIRELSDACQNLLAAGPNFMYCWLDWLATGANWAAEAVYEIENFFDRLTNETLPAQALQKGFQVNTTSEALAHSIVEWFVCFLTANDEEGLTSDVFTITGSTATDPSVQAGQDWYHEFVEDPNKNCSATMAQWNEALSFTQCNSKNDPEFWKKILNIDLNITTDQQYSNSEGSIQFAVPGVTTISEYNAFLNEHPNLFQYYNNQLLQAINSTGLSKFGINGKFNLSKASDTPWFSCLNATCQQETFDADECSEWAQILSLPMPKNRKGFFQILVITSWTVLGITALVLFLCFNAFPDYNDIHSWEGTVRNIDQLCLCGGGLTSSASVSGSDMSVSHEIAKSLNLLFGGVDMDPTDRLLGIYLVSERQHRRGQQDVFAALQQAGFHDTEHSMQRSSRVLRTLSRLNPKRWRSGQQSTTQQPPDSSLPRAAALSAKPAGDTSYGCKDEVDAPEAVPLQGGSAVAATMPNGAGQADAMAAEAMTPNANAAAAADAARGKLPLSPFQDSKSLAAQRQPLSPFEGSNPLAAQRQPLGQPPNLGDARLMLYQHSMVRLASSVIGGSGGQSVAQDLAAAEARQPRDLGDAEALAGSTEPEHVLVEPEQPASNGSKQNGGILKAKDAPQEIGSWQSTAIRVVARYHPLLTPSGCAGASQLSGPRLSPQDAADIYAGQLDAVDQGTLREAQRISRFAVAAYGLQSVIWAKGRRPGMCLANANRLVKCFKRPFGLEDKFRKRNFDAILKMTGVQPADLLYVSYANVAGGVLPYLIMLHCPSKSVVLSVRGTVSMEDLITDLLSNPVDVAEWVPDWVREESQQRKSAGIAGDASGDSLKAHIGIVSSATAILKDMEERGLLREMLLSKLLRAATMLGRDTQEVIAEFLETHKGELPQLVPQQQAASRTSGVLHGDPLAAAAAGEGLRDCSIWRGSNVSSNSEEDEQPQFKDAERRHLSRLQTLKEEREVDLPLKRAQTILRSKLQLEGWKVVVTGHSLGAAVATLLGMQLRERFADLQCWAFNPPGGLVSWELAQIAQRYCTSMVVGKDVISRLSFSTSKRVVDEMVVSLARCKRPKLKIMFDVVLGRRKLPESTPHTFCKFEEIAPEAVQLVEQYYHASYLHMQGTDTTEMYPPGRLVFLRPFKGKKKQQTVWDAVWIDAATLISEGILVTPSMMAHHRLFVLAEAFESIFAGEVATEAAEQQEQGDEDVVRPL